MAPHFRNKITATAHVSAHGLHAASRESLAYVDRPPVSTVGFAVPDFRPHPLLNSGHLQTIAAVYLPHATHKYRSRQHSVSLVDGDKLILHDDSPQGWSLGGPIVLLVHGLGGTHRSPYVVRAIQKLTSLQVRTFALDLRGCGAGFKTARYPTHAGRSEDIAAALACIRKLCPGSSIILVGYSMSGNMALKMAGEMGDELPAALDSVVAVSPPVNLEACSRAFRHGLNRLYDRYYLAKCMEVLARKNREVCPRLYQVHPKTPRTLREFDELYTAPLCGFSDASHYYSEASSYHVIPKIQLPTLVITADDDPIVPVHSLHDVSYPREVQLHVTRGGGHLGFFGCSGYDPDRRWIDWRIVDWVKSRLGL
jgi:predicted alpha/beta-fold hydrolase